MSKKKTALAYLQTVEETLAGREFERRVQQVTLDPWERLEEAILNHGATVLRYRLKREGLTALNELRLRDFKTRVAQTVTIHA